MPFMFCNNLHLPPPAALQSSRWRQRHSSNAQITGEEKIKNFGIVSRNFHLPPAGRTRSLLSPLCVPSQPEPTGANPSQPEQRSFRYLLEATVRCRQIHKANRLSLRDGERKPQPSHSSSQVKSTSLAQSVYCNSVAGLTWLNQCKESLIQPILAEK